MQIQLEFGELGITPEYTVADIINRACDMVMQLCFPEFEESDIIGDYDSFVIDPVLNTVSVPIKIKISPDNLSGF